MPLPVKAKTRRSGFIHKEVKLTDKAASFDHTLGVCGAGVVACHRLYPILYRNKSPERLLTVSSIEGPTVWTVLRLGDVSKGVNAVAVYAQGLPVRRGCLFRVIHGYTPCIGAERQ